MLFTDKFFTGFTKPTEEIVNASVYVSDVSFCMFPCSK